MDYGRGGMYHSMGGRGGMDYMPPPPPPPRAPGTALDDHLLGPANCHSKSVGSLGWSSGGGLRLATGSDDKTCRIYDVDPGSGSVRPLLKLDAHTDAVVRVAWDPSAPHRLATLGGDRDRTLRLWDVRAGVTAGLSVKLGQEYLNLAWSPDGGFLGCGSASLSGDKGAPGDAKDFMSLVDVRKGSGKAKVLKFPYQVDEFCFSPNGHFMIVTTEHGTVEVASLEGPMAALAAAGEAAAKGQGDKALAALGPDAGASFAKVARAFRAHAGNCFCLALDPAKQRLAVGAKDSLVSVWSLDEMVPLRTLGKHGSSVRSVSFSPDGASLVSSSYDTVLDVSEVATGERSWSVDMGSSAQQVAWQPREGSRLVAIARDCKKDVMSADPRYNRTDFVRLISVPEPASPSDRPSDRLGDRRGERHGDRRHGDRASSPYLGGRGGGERESSSRMAV